MQKAKIIITSLLVFGISLLIGTFSQVSAQSCGGSYTCCTQGSEQPTPTGCIPGVTCTGTQYVCTQTTSWACGLHPQYQVCMVQNSFCTTSQGAVNGCYRITTCSDIGQQYCGGCINGCRPLSQTCSQWIASQCTGGGGGGGGGGSCGNCSDYCAGADQCFSQGGQQVGSRCSGGSCSSGTAPCLICSSGGPAPGDPPPPTCTAGIGGYSGPAPASWWLDIPATQPQTNPATVDPGVSGGVLGPFQSSLGWYTIQNAVNSTTDRNTWYRLEMFSSNPSVLSVSQNYYEWNLYGPAFSWQSLAPGVATITYYVYGKPCPACGWTLSCTAQKQVTVNAPCIPNCAGNQCGQSNGCGGNCPATDAGVPSVPTQISPLSSQSPITVTTNTVTLSWSGGGPLVNNYYVEAYPVGGSCASNPAYCGVVAGTSYSFNLNNLPGTSFQWRVRAQNTSCGAQNSAFSAWQTVGVRGTISGGFYTGSASISGGNCVGSNTTTAVGSGATLTVNGKSGQVLNSGVSGSTFSVSPWFWTPGGNNSLTLNPGVAPNGEPYACTCPVGCSYAGVNSPSTNRRFYIQQNDLVNGGWWQVLGGSAYAAQTSSVAMRSYVPTFYCVLPGCKPYILGMDLENRPDSAGIAVTGGGAVDSVKTPGNQGTNVTQRGTQTVAPGTVVTRIREGYDYFVREASLGSSPSDNFIGQQNDAQKPTSPSSGSQDYVYYRNGDLTILSPWQVSADETIVVFVNGNLTIRDPNSVGQLITVEEDGFLLFVVRGNITVEPSVGNTNLSSMATNIEGIYVADGTLTIQSQGAAAGGDRRFIGAGTFVGWTNVVLQRDFDDGGTRMIQNNTIPAQTFIYRPDFMLSIPQELKRSSYIWQETN